MEKSNEGVFVRRLNVDAGGTLQDKMPTEPLAMTCEANGCHRTDGRDYKRQTEPDGSDWDSEPVFLCPDHKHLAYYQPTEEPTNDK